MAILASSHPGDLAALPPASRASANTLRAVLNEARGEVALPRSVHLRLATLTDLDVLVAVSAACFDYNPIRRRDFRYLLERAHAAVVVLCDVKCQSLVGFSIWEFNQRTRVLYANATCVLPEWRNRGLGRFVLRLRRSVAARLGYRWVRAHIALNNAPSLHLALSEGYEEVARLPDWYDNGQTAVALRLRVGGAASGVPCPPNSELPTC